MGSFTSIAVKFTRPRSVPPAMRSNREPAPHGSGNRICQQKKSNLAAEKEAVKKERLRMVGEKAAWFKEAESRQRRARAAKLATREAGLKETARVLAVQQRSSMDTTAQERSTLKNTHAEENETLRKAELQHGKQRVAQYEAQFIGDTLAEDKRMTNFHKMTLCRATAEAATRDQALADQAASDMMKLTQEARVNAVHEEEERQAAEKAYEVSQARKRAAEQEAAEEAQAVYLAKQELLKGRVTLFSQRLEDVSQP